MCINGEYSYELAHTDDIQNSTQSCTMVAFVCNCTGTDLNDVKLHIEHRALLLVA